MAMTNCPECGEPISDQAPTCPNCGWLNKRNSLGHNVGWFIAWVLIINGILMIVAAMASR